MKKKLIIAAIAAAISVTSAYAAYQCPICKGSGWQGAFKCPHCGGDGVMGN